jgi:[ribosomal protein S5]-alanine N-acetyltransferase
VEKMPYQPDLDRAMKPSSKAQASTVTSDWRDRLPVLTGHKITLRELELTDAPALFSMLTPEEVSRFISPPPTTVEGFERFITWARAERAAGRYACFAVVPHGMSSAIGLFQVRQLEQGFATAEWGFALGSNFWGTGMFIDGGRMVVDFALEVLGVRRLEARAAVPNGRGNGALRKLGAVQEGVLRRSFIKNGQHLDQMLWSILAEEWQQTKAMFGSGPVVH